MSYFSGVFWRKKRLSSAPCLFLAANLVEKSSKLLKLCVLCVLYVEKYFEAIALGSYWLMRSLSPLECWNDAQARICYNCRELFDWEIQK